ncbi:DUF1489 domain-containing protein [Hyphomicrobium sp.]|uniref:DUF1489 family protein n=1 Tax=Hyphomicrobium sp. TaxID=82 RepID=UPI0025C41D88|nr:DUF1489 domain-containing protein [Hyphomicrobium sp.]MCC7250367.1 DUF1489 domain-containing protein [Hyphomicrobium sp.]
MALHIIKLCVGVSAIEDLAAWQRERIREQKARGEKPRLFHATLQTPKRQKELLDGGSLYWVIKGTIQVRQKLVGFEEGQKEDGSPCCRMLLDAKLVPVRPAPRRAFQGWRYLSDDDAPEDLGSGGSDDLAALPPDMRRALLDLGLI